MKALFGFHPQILAEILFRVLPAIERRRAQRLSQRGNRKRRFVEKDGRPREVLPLHQVLMTLTYLRHNVSHSVVGALFGFSADASEDAFADVLPLLRDLFPKEKWEAEKRHRGADSKWQPAQVERLLIDSLETPVGRPSLSAKQKRTYSGKKRQLVLALRHSMRLRFFRLPMICRYNHAPHEPTKIFSNAGPLPSPLVGRTRLGPIRLFYRPDWKRARLS